MKCPKCKKGLENVNVYSEALQIAELNDNSIISYGSVEEIFETLRIECPFCGKEITKLIKDD